VTGFQSMMQHISEPNSRAPARHLLRTVAAGSNAGEGPQQI
jgi:hypothetical protein